MAYLKPEEVLFRAKEFLQCGEYAIQSNMFNAGAICSYAALFWAARAALAYEGFEQAVWEHGELRSKFARELIKDRMRYPNTFSTWLSDGFALRNLAQYQYKPPQSKRVRRMVRHAKEFIQTLEEVMKK